MDPLSITSGVVAVITASGKTLQGLERIWELRNREQEFMGLWNSINGLRTLLASVEIALKHAQVHDADARKLADCLGNIDRICFGAIQAFAALNKLVQEVRPRDSRGLVASKPSMAKWLYRKPKLSQLAKQVADVTTSLAAAIHVLQGVQNFNLSSARMDMLLAQIETLHQASRTGSKHNVPMSLDSPLQDSASRPKDSSDAGVFRNNGPYLAMDVGSRSSSTESFRTARSGHEASPETISSPANVLSSERTLATKVGCERFCQCQCHSSNRLRTPTWTTRLFGSMNFHGNGSILLNRRACNRTFCRRSGCLRVQVSYIAPAWLKAFIVYTKAESLGGIAPSYSIIMPRVIPFSAVVWSMVELGKIPELRELFAHRLASPYDVGVDGVSLLKYAALKGQNEVYHFLLTQNADPYLRDHSGIMAVQPGIDRALSGITLDRDISGTTQMSYDLFITDDAIEQQDFTSLHLIVLELSHLDLKEILKFHCPNINSADANGRTPLLWAAWRGDDQIVELLMKYGANINTSDHEGFTPLAKAAQAGHLHVVRILLMANASIHSRTLWGYEPIHLASNNKINGHKIVAELLAWDANPNAFSHGSGTPLHNAANRGSIETIKTLLAHAADINALGENGDTPTMVALYCWNETAFLHLARAGAQLDIVNNSGHNIVQLATWSASTETWDLIAEYAQRDDFGCIDVEALHDGHGIEHCFDQCRRLWFVGEREDERIERAKFNRMIQSCASRY